MTTNHRAGRMKPRKRKLDILSSAIKVAIDIGYYNLTRVKVAEQAKVSRALVSRYFITIENLRRTVLRYALKHTILEIIAQGVMTKDPLIKNLNSETRQEALKKLINRE